LNVNISIDPTQIGCQVVAKICRDNAFDLANEIQTDGLLLLDMWMKAPRTPGF
jgi:hypothetical protein